MRVSFSAGLAAGVFAVAAAVATGVEEPVATEEPAGDSAPAPDQAPADLPEEWFTRHQSPDGSFDPQGFGAGCRGRMRCGGEGRADDRAGGTGLVLLCYLGFGETHRTPRYGRLLRAAADWLIGGQDADGAFGPRGPEGFAIRQAQATCALAELTGMTGSNRFSPAAGRGVEFLLSLQRPDRGWASDERSGPSDTEATTWAVMALRSAAGAGIEVPPRAFVAALLKIEDLTDPLTGRTGFQRAGDRDPAAGEPGFERTTAMALFARRLCGEEAEGDPWSRATFLRGRALLEEALPGSSGAEGGFDPVYEQFGTWASFHAGGEHWKRWNDAMKKAVVDTQVLDRDSCACGSWDPPPGPCAGEGRLVTTALRLLSLEVYYRYARVFGKREGGGGQEPAPSAPSARAAAARVLPSPRLLRLLGLISAWFPMG